MNYENSISIFSIFHKPYEVPKSNLIIPLQVGKHLSKIEMSMASDNTGDHIAEKNGTHSELTALYWIWKHLDSFDCGFIGLCHYRRYFTLPRTYVHKKFLRSELKIDPRPIYSERFSESALNQATGAEFKAHLIALLKNSDIILPCSLPTMLTDKIAGSIKEQYIYHHIKEDWYLMRDAVLKLHPNLTEQFDSYFDQTNQMYCFNMFISNKQIFSDYCSWLFPIISELEKTVKVSEYPYQRRIFGFFSERLLNLYVKIKNLKVAELPVIFFES